MFPKVFVGELPGDPLLRRRLRDRALRLHASWSADEPTYLVLNVRPRDLELDLPIDLIVLRRNVVLIGMIYTIDGPVDVLPTGEWIVRAEGRRLLGPRGETPLATIRRVREVVHGHLQRHLTEHAAHEVQLGRMIGALICEPATHADTRVSLDVQDHRRLIKVLGLDELPATIAMSRGDARLDEPAIQIITTAVFGGRCVHDGSRLVFDPALSSYRLRLLDSSGVPRRALDLLVGENPIGRRVAAPGEHRLSLRGDDRVSNEHAFIVCLPDGRVVLHDTSLNGTLVRSPNGRERRLNREEVLVEPGSIIRMGDIQMRLERLPDLPEVAI